MYTDKSLYHFHQTIHISETNLILPFFFPFYVWLIFSLSSPCTLALRLFHLSSFKVCVSAFPRRFSPSGLMWTSSVVVFCWFHSISSVPQSILRIIFLLFGVSARLKAIWKWEKKMYWLMFTLLYIAYNENSKQIA